MLGAALRAASSATGSPSFEIFAAGLRHPGKGAHLHLPLGHQGRRCGYLAFSPEELDLNGNVVNPVHRGKPAPLGVVHYRNNQIAAPPGSRAGKPQVYNPGSFDLWAAGADGRPIGTSAPEMPVPW